MLKAAVEMRALGGMNNNVGVKAASRAENRGSLSGDNRREGKIDP